MIHHDDICKLYNSPTAKQMVCKVDLVLKISLKRNVFVINFKVTVNHDKSNNV